MNTPSVKSLGELGRLHLRLRLADRVQVSRVGSHFRARIAGHKNCVFGSTREEAIARLHSAQSKRWGFVPAPVTPIERQLMVGLR